MIQPNCKPWSKKRVIDQVFAVLNLSYDRSQALALAHMYEASMRAICGTRRNGQSAHMLCFHNLNSPLFRFAIARTLITYKHALQLAVLRLVNHSRYSLQYVPCRKVGGKIGNAYIQIFAHIHIFQYWTSQLTRINRIGNVEYQSQKNHESGIAKSAGHMQNFPDGVPLRCW